MASQIAQQIRTAYIDGLYVDAEDNLLPDAQAELNIVGETFASLIGAVDALPSINPVTIGATLLNITVGGANQWLFCQGRMCDYIPSTVLAVPANSSGMARVDIVAVKYNRVSVAGPTQPVQQPAGNDVNTVIDLFYESVTWDYVEGTPGSGQPATPGGYELFAVVDMPNGASTPSSIIVQFMTPQQLIVGGDLDVVFALNGLHGNLALAGADGGVTFTPSGSTITLAVSRVQSLNGQTGAFSVTAGANIAVNVVGGNIQISATGSITFNGETGAITLAASSPIFLTESPTGTFTISTTLAAFSLNGQTGAVSIVDASGGFLPVSVSGGNVQIGFAGVETVQGQSGAITLDSPDTSISVTNTGGTIHLEANLSFVLGVASPVMSSWGGGSSNGQTLSITLPSGGTWFVRYDLNVGLFQNIVSMAVTAGTVTDTQQKAAGSSFGTSSSGVTAGVPGLLVCLATGGQSITVTTTKTANGGNPIDNGGDMIAYAIKVGP